MGGLVRRRRSRSAAPAVVLLLASLTSGPLAAQMLVETRPSHVRRGTLFQIRITPTLNTIVTGVEGRIAGEALHFLPSDGLSWAWHAPWECGRAILYRCCCSKEAPMTA